MLDNLPPQRESLVSSATARALSETLANIDFVHAREMDRVLAGRSPPEAKQIALANLECRHHERRRVYVQALAELSRRDVWQRAAALAPEVAVVARDQLEESSGH